MAPKDDRPRLGSVLSQMWRVLIKSLSTMLVVCPRSLRPASGKHPNELHPTAYLDALRGFAAWIVYNHHVDGPRQDWRPQALGEYSIVQLVFQGPAMVDVFFIISGFALTWQVLGHMHDNRMDRMLDSLVSSVFRRHLRLYLPLICASFVVMVVLLTGIATQLDGLPVPQGTFLDNLWFWICDQLNSWNPYFHVISWWKKSVRGTHTWYIPQAWTIPVEFHGSMVLYIFCIGVCKLTTRGRMMATFSACALSLWYKTIHTALFFFGMWLADRRHQQARHHQDASLQLPTAVQQYSGPPGSQSSSDSSLNEEAKAHNVDKMLLIPSQDPDQATHDVLRSFLSRWTSRDAWGQLSSIQQLSFLVLLVLSVIPLTAPTPMTVASPWPYSWLAYTYPPLFRNDGNAQQHWPYAIGAIMMCYSLDNLPLLQKQLKRPFAQCIGELSFGLYIMHNLVRWIVWNPFVAWTKLFFGTTSGWSVIPAYVAQTILVLWAAELFRRMDVKCVVLTKRFQAAVFKNNS